MCLLSHFCSVFFVLVCIQIRTGEGRRAGRVATIAATETCTCEGPSCNCCVTLNPQNANSNIACLETMYLPNDFALNINLLFNGESIYKTKIDSGNFPICAPILPPICWAFNHIHIDQDGAQVCSEIRIGPMPILKVPCLSYARGNFVTSPNIY